MTVLNVVLALGVAATLVGYSVWLLVLGRFFQGVGAGGLTVIAAKFVNEMSVKIVNLAPDLRYKVVRPLKYRIDLTNVNVRFLQNIPKPQLYPVQGVSQDPKFYEKRLNTYHFCEKVAWNSNVRTWQCW